LQHRETFLFNFSIFTISYYSLICSQVNESLPFRYSYPGKKEKRKRTILCPYCPIQVSVKLMWTTATLVFSKNCHTQWSFWMLLDFVLLPANYCSMSACWILMEMILTNFGYRFLAKERKNAICAISIILHSPVLHNEAQFPWPVNTGV
jgi:hypothetical protein